jgi:hypothetical protein
MFYWVDVAILDVTGVVLLVSDQVFPKSTLPNGALSALPMDLIRSFFVWH